MDRFGRWLFMLRNYLASVPLVFALLSTRNESEAEWIVWSIAIVVAGAGVMLRAWATCHCNYGQGEKRELTLTGPYAYIRNPLYVGNILIAVGATVASELLWFVPVTLIWTFAVYAAVARFEEGRMLAKFGDAYREYCSRVPAWLPSAGVRASARSVAPFFPALATQSLRLMWLAPFILKELRMFGLGAT